MCWDETPSLAHLELLREGVHCCGLRQQRGVAAALLQPGHGHPAEGRVRRMAVRRAFSQGDQQHVALPVLQRLKVDLAQVVCAQGRLQRKEEGFK